MTHTTHKPKIAFLLLAICALLTLAGCGAPSISSSPERDYQAAEELLAQGQYAQAAEKFASLGSYEEASRLLMYSRAAAAAENGDFDSAKKAFTALGEFRDSPTMLQYYTVRESETAGRSALSAGDYSGALSLLKQAAADYDTFSGLRDTAERAASCLSALYEQGRGLLEAGRYAEARDLFAGLGDVNDSSGMKTYCEACLLDADGESLEAAALFAGIPSVLDASSRAEAARAAVYQQAVSLAGSGEPESAVMLFSSLGAYRDAEDQLNSAIRLLVQDRLKARDYEGALYWLDRAPDAVPLKSVDTADWPRFAAFLDAFVNAYLNFSAGTMDSWAGYYSMMPFIEQGGSLDRRFIQVTMIGSYSHNSYYQYYGSELLDLFLLEGGSYVAYVRASASASQPAGPNVVDRTFRILVQDIGGNLVAESLEDCLYGQENPHGRPVVTGPLPGGQLPADEDGDGIIIVDVMKKGFNGTMIIVLDPSRVFVGGPGAYGGSGMMLDELAKRYDALGGINGGGFIDEDGGGSGGLPEGLTIVDGKYYHWRDSGASAAFDDNNVLHVRYYDEETAKADHIRDCVSFGPALIVDGAAEYGD